MAASIFVWPGLFTNNGTQIIFTQPIGLPDGSATNVALGFSSDTSNSGWFKQNTATWALESSGIGVFSASSNASVGIRLGATLPLSWASGDSSTTGSDTFLMRDAANTLALKNGTNGQIFNVYNTFTDASNNERLQVGVNVAGLGANTFGLYAQKNGTGTARRLNVGGDSDVMFLSNAANQWLLNTSGNIVDQGAHSITAGSSITVGSTTLLTATNALTDASGAQVGTITNAPTAGNPTKWITIVDNGTTRKIPTWT